MKEETSEREAGLMTCLPIKVKARWPWKEEGAVRELKKSFTADEVGPRLYCRLFKRSVEPYRHLDLTTCVHLYSFTVLLTVAATFLKYIKWWAH